MNKKRSFKELVPGLFMSLVMSFMLLFFEPLILYFTNEDQFWFDIYILAPVMLLAWIIGSVVNLAVVAGLYFIKLKIYRIALVVESVCFVCLYIQGNYLSKNLPALDGRTIDWNGYTQDTVISVVLWLVVIAAAIFVCIRYGLKKYISCIPVVAVCVFLMFAVTLVSVCITNNGMQRKLKTTLTTANQYEMSKDKNFIIFVVDACDSGIYQEVAKDNPQYKRMFKDFTYYPDTVSAYPFTAHSIPFIIGGEWADNTVSFTEYSTNNYKNSGFLKALKDDGYKLGMYEDDLTYEDKGIFDFENVIDGAAISSRKKFMELELQYSLFKYMPYGLKQFFMVDISSLGSLLGAPDGYETYSGDNRAFYLDMKDTDITYTNDKVFRFMHINGAHVPFQYDKDLNVIDTSKGTYEQNIQASLKIVGEYLDKLKKAEVYDNSVIIIMADHGYNNDQSVDDHTVGRQNPILFVKGINEHHDLEISMAPISFDDLSDAYPKLMKGSSGNAVFNSKEGDKRKRKYILYYYLKEEHMVEYYQNGYASDMDTLIPSGKVYDLQE